MSEYAPAAIRQLFDAIHKGIPAATLSGIIGDRAHAYGYHRARAVLPRSDYSVQVASDTRGDGWAASALDVSLPPEHMKLVTGRLIAAAKGRDTRLRAVREFCGTTNGTVTHGYDLHSGRESLGEWDNSHLWHVHLSIYRQFANDAAALAPIAAVMTGSGKPVEKPAGAKAGPVDISRWPLAAGNYFGLITGPTESHGGYEASEQPYIKRIQQRLQALGYAPTDPGWADGIYEKPTYDAVAEWQREKYAAQTTRYGEIWSDDWQRLFS
jgi:hypothetical protein